MEGVNNKNSSHLKLKMDEFIHFVYKVTKNFPKDEIYGITSQLRRAALSIILNYIEGFARFKSAVTCNFWEIAYGSLKETKYLLNFSYKEGYLKEEDYQHLIQLTEEIGAMLWQSIKTIKSKLKF